MKSANKLVLSPAFWKREKPDGLKKSDKKFESAVDVYAKAFDALGKPKPGCLKVYDSAEQALKVAASDVASEAEKLAAAFKQDKKKKEPYDNTAAVMKKPLARILQENRKTYEAAAAELDGGDTADDPFSTDEAQAAYIKAIAPKLRRREMNFALALQSNKPAEMRFNFHPSKGGRTLLGPIKDAVKVKKFTFGTAAAGSFGDGEHLEDSEKKARTLVLTLHGKMIPSLAKRVKVMMRTLGVSAFNKVTIRREGADADAADDETDDLVDDLDMDAPDEDVDPDHDTDPAPAGPGTKVGDGDPPGGAPKGAPPGGGDPEPAPQPVAGGSTGGTGGAPAAGTPDPARQKAALEQRYAALSPKMAVAVTTYPKTKEGFEKLRTAYTTALAAGDLAKVEAALDEIERNIKAADQMKAVGGKVADFVHGLSPEIAEALGLLSADQRKEKEKLKDSGLTDVEQTQLVKAYGGDETKMKAAVKALGDMKGAKVPPPRRYALLQLHDQKPDTYAAMMAALKTMDGGTPTDATIDAIGTQTKEREKHRLDQAKALRGWLAQGSIIKAKQAEKKKADEAVTAALAAKTAAGTAHTNAVNAQTAAKTARDAAKAELEKKKAEAEQAKAAYDALVAKHKAEPVSSAEDLAKRTGELAALSAARSKAITELTSATQAHAAAETKLAAATTKTPAAKTVLDTATAKHSAAVTAAATAQTKLNAEVTKKRNFATAYHNARRAQEPFTAKLDKIDSKRQLLDELSHGKLAPGSTDPGLTDAQVKTVVETYGKNPAMGKLALDLIGQGKNIDAVIAALPELLTFAAQDIETKQGGSGGALRYLSESDKQKMMLSALRNTADRGISYVDGLKAYYAAGKHKNPDPSGGFDTSASVTDVSTKRAAIMGNAALKADGTIDIAAAQASMQDMLYHPGALLKPTPELNKHMEKTIQQLKDPKAQTILNGVSPPPTGNGQKIVGGTVGKPGAALTAYDTKSAVLSAMFSPIQQGAIGSCFTTGPARKMREDDPMGVMQHFANIATTGTFKPAKGPAVPANTSVPKGENPLMRSFEYSAASVAASKENSRENKKLNDALFDQSSGSDLDKLSGIVGNVKWNVGSVTDTAPFFEASMRSRMMAAIQSELKWEYNATPKVSGGGGDGRSTDGHYELMYKGKALVTEPAFVAALQEIALKTAGETKTSDTGKKILTVIADPAFRRGIIAAYNKSGKGAHGPWNTTGGGFAAPVTSVLEGKNLSVKAKISAVGKNQALDRTDRAKKILSGLISLDRPGTQSVPLSTNGDKANHAFNGLPDHPSMAAIKPPDSDRKIKDKLLDPGKAIASRKLALSETKALHERVVRKVMAAFPPDNSALIGVLLRRMPTDAMAPKAYADHMLKELDAFLEKHAKDAADAWKTKFETGGTKTATPAQYIAKATEEKKAATKKARDVIATDLAANIPLPSVTFADTNWGSGDGQTFFVMAPDPTTGDLRMWQRKEPGGKLIPVSDGWMRATWWEMK